MFDLESKIKEWSDALRQKGKFMHDDILELESHLRDEIDNLIKKDLSEEEAFIIAVKRLGDTHSLAEEYAKINNSIWKELIFYENDKEYKKKIIQDIFLIVLLSLIAGTLAKIPQFFGIDAYSPDNWGGKIYFKNISLFFLPCIAFFFLYKKPFNFKSLFFITPAFIISAVVINLTPIIYPYHTAILTGLHLPFFLWLVICVAYTKDKWRDTVRRMDFLRFSGESFIYSVLLFCGVMILYIFTMIIFKNISLLDIKDIEKFYVNNILIYTLCAIPIIAVYLVEAKKSIVENIAPILARIFSPLFLITMIFFIFSALLLKADPYSDRNFLIAFNIMLFIVLGLTIYVISARKKTEKILFFDWINLMLIICAIIIDTIALSAIISRINIYGFSANKTAALGINIILLINLSGLAFFYILFFIKKSKFILMEKWQTFYLYIYFIWTGFVAFIFPVIFDFK